MFTSCQKTESNLQETSYLNTSTTISIIGVWQDKAYEIKDNRTVVTFSKKDYLHENQYGIIFYEANRLEEYKFSGKCATPPIHYQTFSGTYTLDNNNVKINSRDWRNDIKFDYKIIELTEDRLVVEEL